MIKVGTYVQCAHLFYQYEEMLHKNLDRKPSDEELACGLNIKPRMCQAIKLRFDKHGVVKLRLIVVAERMGISVERVRQLIGIGLRQVRRQIAENRKEWL